MHPLIRRFTLITVVVIIFSAVSAQEHAVNKISAAEIVQKAIDNNGGEHKLDSITSGEYISQIITPKRDTLSFAVKRKGFDKYYVSVLSLQYENSTTVYNHGEAFIIKNGFAKKITEPIDLEDLALQCYVSIDFGYKKLGYKLKRLEDKKFENFDCYVVLAESPLANPLLNYYDKKTGDLIMVIYSNGNKTILPNFYETKGIRCPSRLIMVGAKNEITESSLAKINYDEGLDDNWFRLPKEGLYSAPEIFREGTFRYINSNDNAKIVRTNDAQVEIDGESKTLFKVKWIGNNDYFLYRDTGVNTADVANKDYLQVRIITWQGSKYYCHYLTSNKIGGTCAFEKIE